MACATKAGSAGSRPTGWAGAQAAGKACWRRDWHGGRQAGRQAHLVNDALQPKHNLVAAVGGQALRQGRPTKEAR